VSRGLGPLQRRVLKAPYEEGDDEGLRGAGWDKLEAKPDVP
jgi:hypothetical protein